jgi:hypothetical protein
VPPVTIATRLFPLLEDVVEVLISAPRLERWTR